MTSCTAFPTKNVALSTDQQAIEIICPFIDSRCAGLLYEGVLVSFNVHNVTLIQESSLRENTLRDKRDKRLSSRNCTSMNYL